MEISRTPLEGLLLVRPRVFRDSRGWFYESYNRDAYLKAGIAEAFVQDNHSRSSLGTLRGLHFQTRPGQAKLVRCTSGRIWDVAVDIRPGSPTLGRYFGVELTGDDPQSMFIPIGFAHGFLVLSEAAEVQYKCSNLYDPATESGIAWDDPDLGVPWPLGGIEPVLSNRDRGNPSYREYRAAQGI
ncbi:MAG TPA: dTDP-4-dehydrorhamnose 3,5-epimerase [Fibrobacteria bacterium]|nr:dTDP-4-dehydrorhamnose 3,5-epimerase [Fibrobacteria bacterium]